MFREWTFADGPADMTTKDVGTTVTVTVIRSHKKPVKVRLELEHVGSMFGGAIRSFGGRLHIDRGVHNVSGTYNTRDRTGSCHTTDT